MVRQYSLTAERVPAPAPAPAPAVAEPAVKKALVI